MRTEYPGPEITIVCHCRVKVEYLVTFLQSHQIQKGKESEIPVTIERSPRHIVFILCIFPMAFQHLHLLYHIQRSQLKYHSDCFAKPTKGLASRPHWTLQWGVCMPILVVLLQHTDKDARLQRSFPHSHQYLKTSGEHVSPPQRAGVGLSGS